ncbi:MAG: ABC transporter substrate-binding protein [Solirubrobacteraceae bacterium]|nr:ABC transporter substrate-binding protein [Solirubrobacteraceae bacterium]
MHKRFRSAAVALATAALALGAAACGSDSGGSGGTSTGGGGSTAADGGKIVYSNVAETATLDPAVVFSSDGFVFVRNVYEGLLEYEPGTLKVRPLLATEWTESDDGLTYTFTLRDDVTFHDGAKFDAEAAKLGIERIIAVNQGPATLASNIKKIEAVSPTKLKITLKQKDVYFLGTLPKLPIVSPKALEEHKTADDEWATEWFTTHAAGTGPYKLVDWKRNSAIELAKNESYWREFEPGTPTEVTLRTDPDVQTALQLLGQGEIDLMGAVGPDDSEAASHMPGVKIVEQPSLQIQVLPLNVSKGPLKDEKVRAAIAKAFDYNAIIDFYKGYAERANGPLPAEFSPAIAEQPAIEQNIEEAKQLLADAGHPNGGFTVEYLGLKGLAYEEFTGTLLEDVLGQLGIKVKQTIVPWPQMVEIQSNPKRAADISFLNMSPMTNDPSYMLKSSYASANIASKGGYNWSYYENPELDKEINAISTIADDAERQAKLAELNKKIADQNIVVYVAAPKLAQPVRDEWDVTYDTVDATYSVRFFYVRKQG